MQLDDDERAFELGAYNGMFAIQLLGVVCYLQLSDCNL